MIEHCRTMLRERASEWRLPAGGQWDALFHNNYQPTGSSYNLLWFHGKERFPKVVVKIYGREDILAREFQALAKAHKVAPRHVPQPLALYSLNGVGVLWMSGVPGYRIPPNGRYSYSDMASLVDIVVSIHRGLDGGKPAHPDRYNAMIATPLRTLAEFGSSAAVREGCAEVIEKTAGAWVHSLPVIPQHGDLFLDNVLHFRDEWHIVDWECFGAVDLPLFDLVTLAFSALSTFGAPPDKRCASRVRHIAPLVERYAGGGGLDLPAAFISPLVSLTLANRFYLNWLEKRERLINELYWGIEQYFIHQERWAEIFLGVARRPPLNRPFTANAAEGNV